MNNWLLTRKNKNLNISDVPKAENLGAWGERVAREKYQSLGYKIVEGNFSNSFGKRLGEIDFIATFQNFLVFVEVKTRTGSNAFEAGVLAVTPAKQKKLMLAARYYLHTQPKAADNHLRFDVCVVEADKFDKNRFSVTILENVIESRS